MIKKTVICHFYNEEHLLPWWLRHHKKIFDHGIMIDYHSTDRSMEIIREICPDWEIRYTRNKYFNSTPIDTEVMDIEKWLSGWRIALNVTEFLYGNTDHLNENPQKKTQYLIGNYVFVDMQDPLKEPTLLDHKYPLHSQRRHGFDAFKNDGIDVDGAMGRMHRSLHNYPVKYNPGRHFGDGRPKSFDDLVLFYYGWADSSEKGLQRKLQIQTKTSETNFVHIKTQAEIEKTQQLLKEFHSRDLSEEIAPIIEHNRRCTGDDW